MSYHDRFFELADKSNKDSLNALLFGACISGNLDRVRYVLASPELKIHANIDADNYKGFFEACERGYLDIVKYMLTSPELKEHADIHAKNDYALVLAINFEYLDMIEYLLFSPELKEHADVNAHNFTPIESACYNGSVNIVQYLTTHEKLKEKTCANPSIERGLIGAFLAKQNPIMEYLIFDLKIEKNDFLKSLLEKSKKDFSDSVKKMFSIRDLKNDLENNLVEDIEKKTKKVKL